MQLLEGLNVLVRQVNDRLSQPGLPPGELGAGNPGLPRGLCGLCTEPPEGTLGLLHMPVVAGGKVERGGPGVVDRQASIGQPDPYRVQPGEVMGSALGRSPRPSALVDAVGEFQGGGIGLLLFFPSFLLGAGGPPPHVMGSAVRAVAGPLPLTMLTNAVRVPWLGLGSATGSLAAVAVLAVAATALAVRRTAL